MKKTRKDLSAEGLIHAVSNKFKKIKDPQNRNGKISTTDGESLIITPQHSSSKKKLFKENLVKIHLKYGKALKRLAED